MGRIRLSSGTEWEKIAGYSRAIRVGHQLLVAGTTAMGPDGLVGGGDVVAQTDHIIDKIELALVKLGGELADVVRLRIYVSNIKNSALVMAALGKRFAMILPVCTMVEARLVQPTLLVEIEAEAIAGSATVDDDLRL